MVSTKKGMRRSYRAQLEELENEVVIMAGAVRTAVERAVRALEERDLETAQEIVEGDERINQMEQEIEERCLRLLALQQPLASDLRAITTALKMITDLERIGDHAKSIAEISLRIEDELIKPLIDVPKMALLADGMLERAVEAYENRDAELAEELAETDHKIDGLFSAIFRELVLVMSDNAEQIDQATNLLFVGSKLERIGDHITNLAERIIFLSTGERHDLNR